MLRTLIVLGVNLTKDQQLRLCLSRQIVPILTRVEANHLILSDSVRKHLIVCHHILLAHSCRVTYGQWPIMQGAPERLPHALKYTEIRQITKCEPGLCHEYSLYVQKPSTLRVLIVLGVVGLAQLGHQIHQCLRGGV